MKLFPSTDEYRITLERYFSKHAEYYIETIGRNNWISIFKEKLLTEVSESLDSFNTCNQEKDSKFFF